MSNAKHTPGPWNLHNMEAGQFSIYTTGPIGYLNTDTHPNGQANAKLIAAAPDLLAALQECLPLFDEVTAIHEQGASALRKAENIIREAIAKATCSKVG